MASFLGRKGLYCVEFRRIQQNNPGEKSPEYAKTRLQAVRLRLFLCLGSVFWWDYFAADGISPTPFNTSCGRYGNFLMSARSVTPERTSVV